MVQIFPEGYPYFCPENTAEVIRRLPDIGSNFFYQQILCIILLDIGKRLPDIRGIMAISAFLIRIHNPPALFFP